MRARSHAIAVRGDLDTYAAAAVRLQLDARSENLHAVLNRASGERGKRMSVRELREILGNSVRFTIAIPKAQERPYRAQPVAATWLCGCEARGISFVDLSVFACETHRYRLAAPVVHG